MEKLPHRPTDPRQCTVLGVPVYIMGLNVLNPTVAQFVHRLLRVGVHAPQGVDIYLGELQLVTFRFLFLVSTST